MTRLHTIVLSTFAVSALCFAAVIDFKILPLEDVSETSSNASVGDLNGDGNPDILLVKGRHWKLTSKVLLGDGKGHFRAGPALPGNATKSFSGSLADMTKSGHLDIILSNDAPDPKLILLNDGKGNFKVGGAYGDPKWSTRNAATGDLNGDGYPDIAVANRGMTSYVCYSDGKLHFKCTPLRNTPSAASIIVADVDGDGLNDVIVPCRDECQSRLFLNHDLAGEGSPWGPAKASIRAIAVADLNGDGYPDIAACPAYLGCFVYFNDGKGNFAPGIQFQKPDPVELAGNEEQHMPYSMAAADLNGDGRTDLVVGYVDAPGVVYYNDGTGKTFTARPFGDGKGTIYGMATGDLDGDGQPDIVAARSDAPSFVLFINSRR